MDSNKYIVTVKSTVLIYPEWIVNTLFRVLSAFRQFVLIYPEWIVNPDTP